MNAKFEIGNGLRVTQKGISFFQQMECVFDNLSDEDLSKFGLAALQYVRSVKQVTGHSPQESTIRKFILADFEPFQERYVYKYTPSKYLDHYRHGRVKLGTLRHYHTIEKRQVQDPLEGYTILKINSKENDCVSLTIAGLNQFIFCCTDNLQFGDNPNQDMQTNFGDALIKIDIHSFAKKIQHSIKARGYKIYKVKYANAKCFELTIPTFRWTPGTPFMWQLYSPLRDCGYIPNLFIKPEQFSPESEIRISFDMPRDVHDPIEVTNKGLLKNIEIRPYVGANF